MHTTFRCVEYTMVKENKRDRLFSRRFFLYSLIKMTDELGSHVYKSQVGAACQGFTEGVKTFKLNKKVIFLQNSGRIY